MFETISDKKLTYISLLVSVAGLIMLVLITTSIEPKEIAISQISGELSGQDVDVRGIVISVFSENGNIHLMLGDSAKIRVVMFSSDAEKQPWVYDIQKGDRISVIGKVQIYRNELEILAKTMKAADAG